MTSKRSRSTRTQAASEPEGEPEQLVFQNPLGADADDKTGSRRDLLGDARGMPTFDVDKTVVENGFAAYLKAADAAVPEYFGGIMDERGGDGEGYTLRAYLREGGDFFSETDAASQSDAGNGHSTLGDSAQQTDAQQQLEELQIRTIYSLVEAPVVEISGETRAKKLLFLSNKQARQFDFAHIDRLLHAMEIPEPKLIILLGSSLPGESKAASYGTTTHFKSSMSKILSGHTHSELGTEEFLDTDRRLRTFLEDHLLPVARQTHALVVCYHKQCQLSFAFNQVCQEYAKTVGGKLPFTLLHMNDATRMPISSRQEGRNYMAYQLRANSKRWQVSMKKLESVWPSELCKQESCDVPDGCSHYIIVDGVTKGEDDAEAFLNFQAQVRCRNIVNMVLV